MPSHKSKICGCCKGEIFNKDNNAQYCKECGYRHNQVKRKAASKIHLLKEKLLAIILVR